MTGILVPICRVALRASEWLTPQPLREEWRREWLGDLWRWMCMDAAAGARDGLGPLVAHTRAAVREAFHARFRGAAGSPWASVAVGISLLALLALVTDGFAVSRRLVKGAPYPDPDRVVLLAQGPPTLGLRLGFLESEADILRRGSKTLEAIATYTWYPAKMGKETVRAAGISGEYFQALGVKVPGWDASPETFLASFEFWKDELKHAAVGKQFEIDGKQFRLGGVLPAEFSFLEAPISIFKLRTADKPPPKEFWWRGLKGTVARLRTGVSPVEAEKELRQLLADARVLRQGSQVHATPIRLAVYRALGTYGSLFLFFVAGIVVWVGVGVYHDRRQGFTWRSAAKFWGFLAAKLSAPMLALFLFVFELTGVNRLGLTGGIWWGVELFAMWVAVCGVAMLLTWARWDQRGRCRVCLHRMHQPVRIGVPGQMLLDPAGEEVMCPQGHGSMYTSQSVLGAEMSERWVGFAS